MKGSLSRDGSWQSMPVGRRKRKHPEETLGCLQLSPLPWTAVSWVRLPALLPCTLSFFSFPSSPEYFCCFDLGSLNFFAGFLIS